MFYLLASVLVAFTSGDALSAAGHKPLTSHRGKGGKAERHNHRPVTEAKRGERAPGPRTILPDTGGSSTPASELSPELVALKQALQLVQQRKFSDAAALGTSIDDPTARKLVKWASLRHSDNPAAFDDYNSFIKANPTGRAYRCCAGVRKQGCGKNGAMRRSSAASLARNPPVRMVGWRSRVHCSARAIVQGLRASSEPYGIQQNCQPNWKARSPTHSATN